jgi:L-lactate dehydrogenase complex protein LldG
MAGKTEMSARDDILASIRTGLRSALLPDAADAHPGSSSVQATPGEANRFQAEVEALSGQVYRVSSPADAARQVAEIVQSAGADRVLSWSEEAIGITGLQEALHEAGIDWHEPDEGVHPSAYKDFEVGLTGADAGLAEVGALVLESGPGRARSASMLPPVHVAILSVEYLYTDMAAYFAAHPDTIESGSNLVFIAGPSRTADIELTLTLGVHGPGEFHVVLAEGG